MMPEPTPVSPFKSTSGLARIRKALGYSLKGLCSAWQHEHAFRQELWLLPVVVAAWWLPSPLVFKVLVSLSYGLILVVELINSAIEAVVDRISVDHHPLSGRAKDLGSAAVLLAFLNFVVSLLALAWGAFGG